MKKQTRNAIKWTTGADGISQTRDRRSASVFA
jgi:hypothetical protein